MRDYSYKEIGMLAGAAIGGALAVIAFSISNNVLFFIIAGVGVAAGIIIGEAADRQHLKK